MQAIALSLKDCPVTTDTMQSEPSRSRDARVLDGTKGARKGKEQIHEGSGWRKRKKPVCNACVGFDIKLKWFVFYVLYPLIMFLFFMWLADLQSSAND